MNIPDEVHIEIDPRTGKCEFVTDVLQPHSLDEYRGTPPRIVTHIMLGDRMFVPAEGPLQRSVELIGQVPEIQLMGALAQLATAYAEGMWSGTISTDEATRKAQVERAVSWLQKYISG